MPNHTDNRVILSHADSQKIDDIYNVMNTDDASLLQHIIPMNESLLDGGDWYEWRLDNWGTKWDIYETHCTRIDANTLQLNFLTAWSPPIPVFDKLTDMGFDVYARYLDEGWMYVGEYTDEGGWFTEDFDTLADVRPDLDDEFGITEMVQEEKEYA